MCHISCSKITWPIHRMVVSGSIPFEGVFQEGGCILWYECIEHQVYAMVWLTVEVGRSVLTGKLNKPIKDDVIIGAHLEPAII